MEREIKFRGRTKDGKWLKGNLVQFNGMCSIVSNKTVEETPLDYVGAAIVQGIVDKDTVGEYTGCKDIDGEEIYEGDILLDENDNPCIVVNRDHEWMLDYRGEFFWFVRDTEPCLCEIVGNVHDDKKLIKDYGRKREG